MPFIEEAVKSFFQTIPPAPQAFFPSQHRENKLDEFISVDGSRWLDDAFYFRPPFVVKFEEATNSDVSMSSKMRFE